MNQNSVEYLQAINFSQPNLVGKSDIKYIRRATPGLIISQSSSRVQTYVKKNNPSIYAKREWLNE